MWPRRNDCKFLCCLSDSLLPEVIRAVWRFGAPIPLQICKALGVWQLREKHRDAPVPRS